MPFYLQNAKQIHPMIVKEIVLYEFKVHLNFVKITNPFGMPQDHY